MSRTDLISDGFTIIRNAIQARKDDVIMPYSKMLMKVCDILKQKEYIEDFKTFELQSIKKIKVYLKYTGKKSAVSQLKRVSSPGHRVYVPSQKIPRVLNGYGTAIISTSKGIMSDKEARAQGVGGEVVGFVW